MRLAGARFFVEAANQRRGPRAKQVCSPNQRGDLCGAITDIRGANLLPPRSRHTRKSPKHMRLLMSCGPNDDVSIIVQATCA